MSPSLGDQWAGAWRDRPEIAEAAAREVASLAWLYVARLAREWHPDKIFDYLGRLGQRDLAHLRRLRFLASPELRRMLAASPALLRRLPQTAQAVPFVTREVRGRVDWPATYSERIARAGDRTLFVVDRTDRHSNTAEIRVLAFLLDRIAAITQEIVRRSAKLETADGGSLSDVEAASARLRANSALSAVRVVQAPSGFDRQLLRISKVSAFRHEVADTLALHDGLFSLDP